MSGYIDSHCHLADAAFAADLTAVVERGQAAGLTAAVCILSADEPDEVGRAAEVRAAWPAVRFAAGVHPHRAGGYDADPARAATAAAGAARAAAAVAIGEIGLDYHYDHAPRAVQQAVFAAQVDLAGALDLPVIIHTRDATADTMAVLKSAAPAVRGVMHCFTGTVEEARWALDLGFYISLSGILTFPRAQALAEVATFLPPDRLLIETDAPYLAPVPHRGARNEPAWVIETFRALARIRGSDHDELRAALARNAAALFGRSVDTPAKPMV